MMAAELSTKENICPSEIIVIQYAELFLKKHLFILSFMKEFYSLGNRKSKIAAYLISFS